jgi:hypothetical protein
LIADARRCHAHLARGVALENLADAATRNAEVSDVFFLSGDPRSLRYEPRPDQNVALRARSTARRLFQQRAAIATGGSLPVVMLAHAGHNIAVNVLPFSDAPEGGGFPLTIISSLYALVALPAAWSLWREGK